MMAKITLWGLIGFLSLSHSPAYTEALPKDPFASIKSLASTEVLTPMVDSVTQLITPSSVSEPHEKLDFAVISLRHANCDDIAELIVGGGSGGLLSAAGKLTADARTNSLVVVDYPEVIEQVRNLAGELDLEVQQVEIEARIVIINQGELEELGVRWGVINQSKSQPLSASIEGTLVDGSGEIPLEQLLSVNLPATSSGAASAAFQLAKLGSDTLLDLELSALQSESKAEVISSPRLLTTNRTTAYIEQGTEIPYLEASEDGNPTVSFKKAVLSLEVTPYLSDNQQLILDLSVTQDRPGEVVKTGNGEAVAIMTQRMMTQVQVANGETIVLGGIQQTSRTNSQDKVPVLGDVPLLGRLFRRDYQRAVKNELLIFVTPTLMNDPS